MKIFKDIKNSVYSPQFYSHKKTESGSKAFWYFIKLSLIISLCGTLLMSIVLIPALMFGLSQENITKIASYYPQDLEVVIKQGIASTNVAEPYAIAIPSTFVPKNTPGTTHIPKNIIVINTKATFDMTSFEAADAFAFLTKDSLIVRDDQKGKVTIQSLKEMPDVQLNKAKITGWISMVPTLLKVIIPSLVVMIYVGLFLLIVISKLFLISIAAILLFVAGKITKSQVTYSQWFKLGLYAVTPLIVIEIIALGFGIDLAWYVSMLVLLATVFVNTRPQ